MRLRTPSTPTIQIQSLQKGTHCLRTVVSHDTHTHAPTHSPTPNSVSKPPISLLLSTRPLSYPIQDNMALRLWASSTANALRISCNASRVSSLSPSFSISRCFSSVLDGLKYTSSHEWVKHEGSVATVGITDHAQDHLGEVVFVELPESGTSVSKGGSFGAVESVKATSDVNSPISGEVVEANSKLTEEPGQINKSPYKDGWMIKVKPTSPAELESLMGPDEYKKFCEEEDASH